MHVHVYERVCVTATNWYVWKGFFGIDGKAVPNDYQQENKQLLQSKKWTIVIIRAVIREDLHSRGITRARVSAWGGGFPLIDQPSTRQIWVFLGRISIKQLQSVMNIQKPSRIQVLTGRRYVAGLMDRRFFWLRSPFLVYSSAKTFPCSFFCRVIFLFMITHQPNRTLRACCQMSKIGDLFTKHWIMNL